MASHSATLAVKLGERTAAVPDCSAVPRRRGPARTSHAAADNVAHMKQRTKSYSDMASILYLCYILHMKQHTE